MVNAWAATERVELAGFGPISDGVPEPIGAGGESERDMPSAPRASKPMYDTDKTVRIRKVKP